MAEIRLTWWSEAIAEIFEGRVVRRHPVTLALARAVAARGLARERLDAMIDGRFELIETPAHASEATEAALMGLALRVLGAEDAAAAPAAALRFGGNRGLANRHAKVVSTDAFPAIAYAGLKPGPPEALGRRLHLLWIILQGRF